MPDELVTGDMQAQEQRPCLSHFGFVNTDAGLLTCGIEIQGSYKGDDEEGTLAMTLAEDPTNA